MNPLDPTEAMNYLANVRDERARRMLMACLVDLETSTVERRSDVDLLFVIKTLEPFFSDWENVEGIASGTLSDGFDGMSPP